MLTDVTVDSFESFIAHTSVAPDIIVTSSSVLTLVS